MQDLIRENEAGPWLDAGPYGFEHVRPLFRRKLTEAQTGDGGIKRVRGKAILDPRGPEFDPPFAALPRRLRPRYLQHSWISIDTDHIRPSRGARDRQPAGSASDVENPLPRASNHLGNSGVDLVDASPREQAKSAIVTERRGFKVLYEVLLLAQDGEIGGRERPQRGASVGQGRTFLIALYGAPGCFGKDLPEELLLALELVVDRSLRDSGRQCDLVEVRRVEAVPRERVGGRFQ